MRISDWSSDVCSSDLNPFGYPTRYGFHGESRTQTIWTNPAPKLSATQMLAFGKLVPTLMQTGLMSSPHGRESYALFHNFFLIGTARNSVGWGKRWACRVYIGGGRIMKKKTQNN